MTLTSRLRPDTGTMTGVLTAAGVALIFSNALPSITDIRSADPHDDDVDHARKVATWESIALIGGVFLVSRDLNSYIISGVMLAGLDLMYKHANGVHPMTGKVDTSDSTGPSMAAGLSTDVDYPMPEYVDAE